MSYRTFVWCEFICNESMLDLNAQIKRIKASIELLHLPIYLPRSCSLGNFEATQNPFAPNSSK